MLRYMKNKENTVMCAVWGRRLIALALCLVMSFSLIPTSAYATEGANKQESVTTDNATATQSEKTTAEQANTATTALEKTYLLRVGTGTATGNGVKYIGVRYEDADGTTRTKYIFPQEKDLENGYKLAKEKATGGDHRSEMLDAIKRISGYVPDNEKGDSHGALQPSNSDDFLFQSSYEIKTVIGFDIYMQSGKKSEWSGKSICLYQVDEVYGVEMAGSFSNNYYISFDGKLLAKWADANGSFTLDANVDQLFRIRDKDITIPSENTRYNSAGSEYLFKFDIADVSGGGIEALATEVADEKRFTDVVEALTVKITYADCLGEERSVKVPAITGMMAWAAELGMIKSRPTNQLVGIAQQGESIQFPCALPGITTQELKIDPKGTENCIKSIQFLYGPDADTAAGITRENPTTRFEQRKTKLRSDTLNITGVQIYGGDAIANARKSKTTQSDTFLVFPSLTGCKPLLSYTVPKLSEPMSIAPATDSTKSSNWIDLTNKLTSSGSKPADDGGTYIAVIKTDNINDAGTEEDVSLVLTYTSITGETKTSEPCVLNAAAKDYYGYWPAKDDANVAYLMGMSSGKELIFKLDLNDVNEFKSVTFKMNTKATDEWQMSDFKIYHVDSIGKRTAKWITSDNAYANLTDRIYQRALDFDKADLVAHYPANADSISDYEKVYLDGDDNSKTINFAPGNSHITDDDSAIKWNDIRYSMSYEQTKTDLGFAKPAYTYEVDVNVASDDQSNMDDGDCGSNNLFYFKLTFEGGSSAYVLANQQLTADGFRAGRTETFYVVTNEDYGPLESISIVPQGNSNSDNQDPYDKLNISNIIVSQQSGGALSKTWKIDNIGWIDMDYYDAAEEQSAKGRRGRSEGELANTYTVNAQCYSVNLLFQMVTDNYQDNDPIMRGSLLGTIEYYDKSGMLCRKTVDVVRAMYEYAKKSAAYYTTTYSGDDGEQQNCAKSNDKFMLRGNHTDRFIVSLADVKQIKSIKIVGSSEITTTWNLKQITINQLETDGQVQMTAYDEYKRTGKVGEDVATSTSVTGYQMSLNGPKSNSTDELGPQQPVEVKFSSNDITVKENDSEWTSVIKRVPNNTNDTVNLYVYMKDPTTLESGCSQTPMDDYNMNAAITWHSSVAGDKNYLNNLKSLSVDAGNRMFYARGIKTSGLDCVNALTLQTSGADRVEAYVDHAVIQHVRSGVTISSYYIDFGGWNVENKCSMEPDQQAPSETADKQVVKLYFSADTVGAYIRPEVNDVVVSIRYKTTNDSGLGNTHYDSYNMFLGNILDEQTGLQKYTRIKPGMTAELTFNEPYVKEIIGITVCTVGNLNAKLSGACVGTYNASSDTPTWYGFKGRALTVTPYMIPVSSDNVVPVKMVITNNTAAQDAVSGTDTPIRMTVKYISAASNTENTYVIDNIRDYCTSGDFNAQSSATVEFCLFDVSSIRSITLSPYTTNGNGATWDVQKIYFEAMVNNQMATCNYENSTIVTADSPLTFNVAGTVTVSMVAKSTNENGTTTMRQTGANGTANISTVCGSPVTITATVQNSVMGDNAYNVSAKENKNGVQWEANSVITYDMDADGNTVVVFNATEPGTYVVTAASQEMASSSASLNITVGGEPVNTADDNSADDTNNNQ